jgi:hypothetical protein
VPKTEELTLLMQKKIKEKKQKTRSSSSLKTRISKKQKTQKENNIIRGRTCERWLSKISTRCW